MEVRRLIAVLQRRLGLIVAITLLTAVVSAVYGVLEPGNYTVRTELLINPIVSSQAAASTHYYSPYYEELAAQFILDDFAEVIRGTSFAKRIVAILKQSPDAAVRAKADKIRTTEEASAFSKQFVVNRVNRVLEIDVSAKTRAFGIAAAAAADQLILKEGPTFFADLNPQAASKITQASSVTVSVSDEPHVTLKPSKLKDGFFWLLRTLVGFLAAVVVAFALHYVDPRLYDVEDLRELVGLPVLGEVVTGAEFSRARQAGRDQRRAAVTAPIGAKRP